MSLMYDEEAVKACDIIANLMCERCSVVGGRVVRVSGAQASRCTTTNLTYYSTYHFTDLAYRYTFDRMKQSALNYCKKKQ